MPYFRTIEHHDDASADPQVHGFDGPIYTATSARNYPLTKPLREAFLQAGTTLIGDTNGGSPHGLGPFAQNRRNGNRQPAGLVYSLAGVNVVTNAYTSRILLGTSEGRPAAKGVELTDGRQYHSNEEVVLCCGAFRSPQILMLSGIGLAEELARFNIQTVLDVPEVGENLHDHLVLGQQWRLRHPEEGLALGSPKFDPSAFGKNMPN